ncbi:hypothetical protein HQN60_03715 [Deefgea piscis]|uniref:Uncharacterized protein n=1 Tax=Deefgea piscis TaxID=2739061 RepID=A0A6M8SQW2_9NEIS|nr:hypothetical protein [Deefgea piscis]QKJ65900.1 hypothetical protein HQN60_03715 [Deefgea piscis]
MNAQDEQITQVILTFAQPVLVGLPNGCSKAQFAGVMRTVLTVWNAVVKDAQDGGNQHETAVLGTIASAPKEVQLMVKRLIKRKKTKFATEQRLIGQHWVHEQGGEVLFGCEAADEQPAPSGVPFKTK